MPKSARTSTNRRSTVDATFFPDRAAKIFYRPASDSTSQHAHLLDTGASAYNELETNVPATEPAFVKAAAEPKNAEGQSTLDALKEKVKAALPSAGEAKAAVTGDVEIGIMGILHPTVLHNYELDYPCSLFEFTLEGL